MIAENEEQHHHHRHYAQQEEDDSYVYDVLMSSSTRSSLLSERSSGILHTIPEDLALEDWESVAGANTEAFAVAWAGILRNEVLLMDIGEENVPETVMETAGGLLELEPLLGWDTFSVSPQIKGLRFHVFDDRRLRAEDDEITVWIFCCVFDSELVSLEIAKLFVQDNMVGLTQTLRAVDPAWLHGDYHACQNLFAPVLQQRIERFFNECTGIATITSPGSKRKSRSKKKSSGSSEPDLSLSNKIIEENRRVVQSQTFDDDETEHGDCPPDLADTDHSFDDEVMIDYGQELLNSLRQDPSLTKDAAVFRQEEKVPNTPPRSPKARGRSAVVILEAGSSAPSAPVTPPRQKDDDDRTEEQQQQTDQVIQVVCLVEEQMPNSPHQDLWHQSPETISQRDATNYELAGKMLEECGVEEELDVAGLLKLPALHVGLMTVKDDDLADSWIGGNQSDNTALVDSLPTVNHFSPRIRTETSQRVEQDPSLESSPTSVTTDFKPPPPLMTDKTTSTTGSKQEDSDQRNCFFCTLFGPKKSALI